MHDKHYQPTSNVIGRLTRFIRGQIHASRSTDFITEGEFLRAVRVSYSELSN